MKYIKIVKAVILYLLILWTSYLMLLGTMHYRFYPTVNTADAIISTDGLRMLLTIHYYPNRINRLIGIFKNQVTLSIPIENWKEFCK